MATNVGPITTIFTPPASCFTIQTSGVPPDYSQSYSIFIGHFGPYGSPTRTCSPPATTSIDYYGEYYYSPAYCPSGYTTACGYTGTTFPANAQVTASVCCPSGFDCVNGWPHVCSSTITAALSSVWVLSARTATMPANAALVTVQPGLGDILWNDGLPVAWQTTDEAIMRMISPAPVVTLPSSPNLLDPIETTASSVRVGAVSTNSPDHLSTSSAALSAPARSSSSSTFSSSFSSSIPFTSSGASQSTGSSAARSSSATQTSPTSFAGASPAPSTVPSPLPSLSQHHSNITLYAVTGVLAAVIFILAVLALLFWRRRSRIRNKEIISAVYRPRRPGVPEADSSARHELHSSHILEAGGHYGCVGRHELETGVLILDEKAREVAVSCHELLGDGLATKSEMK